MTDDGAKIDPSRTALLVMDYQQGIVAMIEDDAPLVAKAQQAIAFAREHGIAVAFVRVAFTDADIESFPPTSAMGARLKGAGSAMHADSPNTAIDARVAPGEGDIVVRKTRVGAFSTTDLAEQLAERGIDTLLLAGISTSGCVLSTVRDGHDRDYALYVLADACADPQPDVHEFLVQRIFPRQGQVVEVGELGALVA